MGVVSLVVERVCVDVARDNRDWSEVESENRGRESVWGEVGERLTMTSFLEDLLGH